MASHLFENVLLSLFLAMVFFVLGRLSGTFAKQRLEREHSLQALRDTIVMRAQLERGFGERNKKRREIWRKKDIETKELFRGRIRVMEQISETNALGNRLLRLVGDEVNGKSCFQAMVFNKYVASGGGQRHALIDRSWGTPQDVEVWAESLAAARMEVEKRYPPSFGYGITKLNPVIQDDKAPGAGKS